MSSLIFRKMARHSKRLHHLSQPQKFRYVAQVLFGELVRKRLFGLVGPRLIEMTLTDRCQCRCVHCYNETQTPCPQANELTTAEVCGVLDEAAALRCSEVSFTGGEPLLREDLAQLIAYARSVRLVPKINTNGLLLTGRMVRNLKEAGLAWCSVSIDSPSPEVHDELRRYAGCYKKAVAGLRELVSQGVPASITTYARKKSLHSGDLRKIVDLGHKLRVETVRILFPVPLGGLKDRQDEVLNREEREFVRQFLADPLVTMESVTEKSRCTAAVTKINVLPDGTVTPCVFVSCPFGNIRKEPLKEIWQRMAAFDRLGKPDGRCPMCDKEFRERVLSRDWSKVQ